MVSRVLVVYNIGAAVISCWPEDNAFESIWAYFHFGKRMKFISSFLFCNCMAANSPRMFYISWFCTSCLQHQASNPIWWSEEAWHSSSTRRKIYVSFWGSVYSPYWTCRDTWCIYVNLLMQCCRPVSISYAFTRI